MERITAGDKAEVHVELKADMPWSLLWLKIEAEGEGLEHSQIIFTGRSRTYNYTYSIRAIHRGVYSFQTCKVTWGDTFGWFTRSCRVEAPCTLIVHPSAWAGSDALRYGTAAAVEGQASRLRNPLYEMPAGYEIREYVQGDPIRHIHWKSTARSGKLQVRIPEDNSSGQAYLLLDNNAASYFYRARDGRFQFSWDSYEAAISACGGLLRSLSKMEIDVRITSYFVDETDHEYKWEPIGEGPMGHVTIMEQLDDLSALEPSGTMKVYGEGDKASFPNGLGSRFPYLHLLRGTQIYLITGASTTVNGKLIQLLGRRGIQVVICEVNESGQIRNDDSSMQYITQLVN
ncbi:DUF58 domain-containing protein [Neobacillus mesonae]|nr:DUF58 domain-containing protein [Neobacillus mesonae]